jgi:hypothetical protein
MSANFNIDTMLIKEHVFVHESGHAIIGVLKDDLHVKGIAFCTTDERYITEVDGPGSDNCSKNFYLFIAGGMAAELLIYGKYEQGTAAKDKAFFDNPDAPLLQQTTDEAKIILSSYIKQIRHLKDCLMMKDVDKGGIPDETVIGNPDRNVRYLLRNGELEDPIKNWEEFCARFETGTPYTHDPA